MTKEPTRQDRLLALAIEEGILTHADLDFASEYRKSFIGWGHRLGLLIATQRITQAQVQHLQAALEDDDVTPVGTQTATKPLELHLSEKATDSPGSLFASLGSTFDPKSIDSLNLSGPYEIRSYLGEGGMGRVFKAWDPKLKRHVALKFLRKDEPEAMSRFLLEAQAQAKVKHAGVCRVYEAGEIAGYPYIAMQLIDGLPLKDVMQELNLEQKVIITREVCEAVHAAHRTGLIHRDIKPGNIMVERSEDGEWIPFVMDFGLAREMEGPRMTATGLAMGTPAYMAPEQARGATEKLDRRTDVYAIGGMLFHMLTGRVVFDGATSFDVIMKVLAKEPRPPRHFDPQLPKDLDTIVMKCLEKEPQNRYESAKALQGDLQRYLDDEPILARPVSLIERMAKKIRKNKTISAVIGLAACLIAVMAFMWGHAMWSAGKQAAFAQRFGQKIERLENELWRTYSLPLHDTSQVKKRIQKQLEDMATQLQGMGNPAQGPGHCALGRGFLAIGRLQQAKKHLEKAWETGYQTPITAYALGQTFIRLYAIAHADLGRIRDSERRHARETEIKREFRAPARNFLKMSQGVDMETPLYLEALLASTDGNDAEAVKLADRAFQEVPHLYQAKILEGNALGAIAMNHVRADDVDEATRAIADAQAAFDACSIIAPSDPNVYLSRSRLRHEIFSHEHYQGNVSQDAYERLLMTSTKTLEADSTALEAITRITEAHAIWTDQLIRRDENPLPACEKGLDMARRAVSLAPNSHEAYSSLAQALLARGKITMMSLGNPEKWFNEAAEAAEQTVHLQPDSREGFDNLGLIYLELANYRRANRKNCRDVLEKSRKNFLQGESLSGRNFASVTNLGMVYLAMGENESNFDRDPREDLKKSAEYFEEARSIIATAPRINQLLGLVHYHHANYLFENHLDPTQVVSQSMAAFDTALKHNPNDAESIFWRASANDILARYLADIDQSPLDAIKDSRESYRRFLELNQSYPWANGHWAFIELLEANWLLTTGENPEAALSRAEEQYKIAQKGFNNPDGYALELCDLYTYRAQWELSKGRSAAEALDKAEYYMSKVVDHDNSQEYLKYRNCELNFLRAKSVAPSKPSPQVVQNLIDQVLGLEENETIRRDEIASLVKKIQAWGKSSD